MSLYDPLGFIAHLTIRGRMLLQCVWKSKTGWDEPLKTELHEKWKKLLSQILTISEATIPRCYALGISTAENIQLHIFCDASQQAFSAVAFLRVTMKDGSIQVNIVKSKARVAPLKPLSIPRMELEAALIGSRLSSFIRTNLDLKIDSTYLWTDSKNVLCWLNAEDPGRFKMYIRCRIGEILDLTEAENWRWVPTGENVADDATRDNSAADVTPTSRWFNGPAFLKEPVSSWPVERNITVEEVNQDDLELRKDCCMVITEQEDLPNARNFSSWLRLTRVTAWMLRFAENMKSTNSDMRIKDTCLSASEIQNATTFWIKRMQLSCFGEELHNLKNHHPIPKSSRIARLSPILVDGILCVKSRLVNAPHLNASGRYPPILDQKHPWTKLLISWFHRIHGHHGIELICNELRQRFWILGQKPAVKKAARECIQCQMEAAKIVVPEMAALPALRVKQPERPFSYVGVDYFGPIEVVNGRKREKRYGVLFTCLSIRAVHLEMANSLSTDDFLLTLNRFICRRGEPIEIWSDNGTNFKGAEVELAKALGEMKQDTIANQTAIRGIKWNFIPPGAPHMGGAWERLVRSVKTALRTILKNCTMNDQLLSTVLTEAEASVNSRPLTVVSPDKNDPEAITPNCFLMGTTSVKQRPGVFPDGDLSLRKRWRHAQVLANHFWSRWLKEYLPSLALRAKWNRSQPDVVVGEIVFVADANEIRNSWTKARVEQVYPGKDGVVRVVDIRTANGVLRRPVAKLYRIPGWNENRDSTQ